MRTISKEEARRFVLRHQGLMGPHRFSGKAGVLAFTQQAGCVQFDPVNVCGISSEITWLSRVKGYKKADSDRLLYQERALIDHFDKNLAIFKKEDWPYLSRNRARLGTYAGHLTEVVGSRDSVLAHIRDFGPQSAATLPLTGKVDGFWSMSTSLARATLEHLYYEGSLLIHSKKGLIKTYDLAENCLGEALFQAEDPLKDDLEHAAWHLKRRVRALGMIWSRASAAWLGTLLWDATMRKAAFELLLSRGELVQIGVEGIPEPLYLLKADEETLDSALLDADAGRRCELIAPLDSLLWDRKLTEMLFDFKYTWEIYTPPQKRLYGAYVLPILYKDRFIGRVEPVCDRRNKVMSVRGLWWEEGVKPAEPIKKAVNKALAGLAEYNGCELEPIG